MNWLAAPTSEDELNDIYLSPRRGEDLSSKLRKEGECGASYKKRSSGLPSEIAPLLIDVAALLVIYSIVFIALK